MIPIYICDDDKNMLHTIAAIIKNNILIHNYDMEIVCCTEDPLEILQEQAQNHQKSIYFLDVDLGHAAYDGFSLAKQLREEDPRGFIVFVTTHEELMIETFKHRLEAIGYLIKEDLSFPKQIRLCLEDIHHLISSEKKDLNHYYTVHAGDNAYQLHIKDILYFETSTVSHHVIVHMTNRRLEFRGNLNAVEKDIGPAFIRIHRSYLVHRQHIASANSLTSTLMMVNGAACLISRRGKRLLKDKGLL